MVKKQEEKKEQVFYVGLADPVEIRRSILESSKEIVQYLQRAERFKKIRTEKAEEMAKLRETMKEAAKMIRRLRTDVPKTNLRAPLHMHEEEEKAALKKQLKKMKQTSPLPVSVMSTRQPSTELEKLEAELGEIESRLTTLS